VKTADKDASEKNPFFKCTSHTTEGVEFKFDFTDKSHCTKCEPKLLATDKDTKKEEDDAEEPELLARDESSIKVYQNLILHPPKIKKKNCSFYVDR